MEYIYCSSCGRITLGSYIDRTSGLVECSVCNGRLLVKEFRIEKCRQCDNHMYIPTNIRGDWDFPCHPTGISVNDDNSLPMIKCDRCQADISPIGNQYGPCPNCGHQSSARYISSQLYFLRSKNKPILINWNPMPGEMVWVHRHSAHITPYSLLIVNPDQKATYQSGGQRYARENGTYLLCNERNAIQEENQIERLPLEPNTEIVFFDCRKHGYNGLLVQHYFAAVNLYVQLPISYSIIMQQPEAYLRQARDRQKTDNELEYLLQNAAIPIQEQIHSRLDEIPNEVLIGMSEERDWNNLFRELLSETRLEEIRQRISVGLQDRYGIEVSYISLPVFQIQYSRRPFPVHPVRSVVRETELRELVRSMTMRGASPIEMQDALEELWTVYHNMKAGALLCVGYLNGSYEDMERAKRIYMVLQASPDGIDKTTLDQIEQLILKRRY